MSFDGYYTEHDDILKNKLGITDPAEMMAIESEIVSVRMAELLVSPPRGQLDMKYLCLIHRRLFADLYFMAGKIRTVDIAKGGNAFCYVQFIDSEQRRIFSDVQSLVKNAPTIQKDAFCSKLAFVSADLNALHPFREGNGRAIRTFLTILAQRCGYTMDFAKVSHQRLIEADIAAFHGNINPLEDIYKRITE